MRRVLRCLLLLASAQAVVLPAPAIAQEVDCTVQVNYEGVPSTNKDYLQNFANDVRDYLNNYKWGSDSPGEKIQCTFNIFISGATGDNQYQAQVFVGSQRKVYGGNRNSAVLRLFDESWEFTYVRDRPLSHNPYSFNDLTSFLDFYIYIILGYDYDTYDPMGGKPYFERAVDIARLAGQSGQKGWQQSTSSYSRPQFIEELVSPIFAPVRKASCTYHFSGLDSLAIAPDKGYRNILQALESIAAARKRADPRNIVIKTFFDTKYMEIASTFENYPDPEIYQRLATIDPTHLKAYEEARAKRKPGN